MASRSTTTEEYQHKPLQTARSIRVLEIEDAVSFEDPIRCSIRQISIDSSDEPQNAYMALSYVWGATKGTEEIFCDGKRLLVTPNCESALRNLRNGTVSKCLWIDALCINQKDDEAGLEEKGHQIKLMGEVYRRASFVLIWLGEVDEATVKCLKYMEKIGEYTYKILFKEPAFWLTRRWYKHLREKCWSKMNTLNEKQKKDFNLPVIENILNHSWFERLWTTQEAALARSLYFCFASGHGLHTLSFHRFNEAWYYLPVSGKWKEAGDLAKVQKKLQCQNHSKRLEKIIDDPISIPLATLHFYLCSGLQAADRRDFVYGTLGMLQIHEVYPYNVDYTKSVEMVFEEAAQFSLQQNHTLHLLGMGQLTGERDCGKRLPTWVPDFSCTQAWLFPSADDTNNARFADSPPITFPAPGQLSVYGRVLGEIRSCITMNQMLKPEFNAAGAELITNISSALEANGLRLQLNEITYWRNWIHMACQSRRGIQNSTLEDTLYKVHCLPPINVPGIGPISKELFQQRLAIIQYGSTADHKASKQPWSPAMKQAKNFVGRNEPKNPGNQIAFRRQRAVLAGHLALPKDGSRELSHLALLYCSITHVSLKFFITKDGCLGRGSTDFREGDSLVLFKGCAHPMAARKVGDFWEFKGRVWVPDLAEPYLTTNQDLSLMQEFIMI